MKIILDESVPRDLAKALRAAGCIVAPFPNAWKGTRNGRLLSKITEAGHNALLTCDKNMGFQQNLSQTQILIAVLPTQRLALLLQHVDEISRVFESPDLPVAGEFFIRFEKSATGR